MTVFELWLPILLAGLATHIISTLAWTVMPHHKPEWNKLPDEDEFLDWVNEKNVPPNQYLFPFAKDGAEMQSEEYKQKMGKCRGTMILWSSPPNMGEAIGKTLAFFFVAAFLIGYLASIALTKDAEFMKVFQFTFTAALLTHCAGNFPHVFWFKRRIIMELLDGVAHALATGLIFAAMWP